MRFARTGLNVYADLTVEWPAVRGGEPNRADVHPCRASLRQGDPASSLMTAPPLRRNWIVQRARVRFRRNAVTTRRLAAVAAVFALFVPASAPATPATPAPATATAAWTGVSEVVVVDVDASGVVSGSPSQATVVTAVSSSTVRSECRCRRPDSAASDRDRRLPLSTTSRSSRSIVPARRPRPSRPTSCSRSR